MPHTDKHPEDYARNYPIISQLERLCKNCGGHVVPKLSIDGSPLQCLTCNGTEWEWVQESDAAEYRANLNTNKHVDIFPDDQGSLAHIDSLVGTDRLTTMQMIDAAELFTPRSYKDKHVPDKTCPKCGGLLIVKERKRHLRTGGDDITPFVACSMWERTGCRYKEEFTAEVKAAIDNAVKSVEVDF